MSSTVESQQDPEDIHSLERMRLDFEREKFHKVHRLQEIRVKWISGLVAVITAIITAGTSVTISVLETRSKDKEIALKNAINEQEYIQQFVDEALSEDLQQRIDFAEYVAMVSTSPEMRTQWQDYHDLLEEKFEKTRADLRAKVIELSEEIRQYENPRLAGLNSNILPLLIYHCTIRCSRVIYN